MFNAIIDFYAHRSDFSSAFSIVQRAKNAGVKVTSVSYQSLCELLFALYDASPPDRELVRSFCTHLCSLDRGGYVVLLGVLPLRVMLRYGEMENAVKYAKLLNRFENGLSRGDLALLEEMQKQNQENKALKEEIEKVIRTLRGKFGIEDVKESGGSS